MKIKIKKNDYRRILFTEVLPYEVPIIYTNIGLYQFDHLKETSHIAKRILSAVETHPFTYKIIKSTDSYRTLHLIHPANQLSFVEFYANYKNLITSLCSRSACSLRSPISVATHYYEKNRKSINKLEKLKDENIEVEPESKHDLEPTYASSFFSYRKYSFLYKFYDSYEFHRCEKKFSLLRKFDISKCFDSISTRSLGIAIKDEVYQKNNQGTTTFESRFSKLLENANFGRSNGIVVGPEFSRIFAEIILQKIDQEAIDSLTNMNNPLIHEKDYAIRRYVDDYFLFFNSSSTGEIVYNTFVDHLEKYRLFINSSKIRDYTPPFITGITIAKKEIQQIFDSIFPLIEAPLKSKKLKPSEVSEVNDEDLLEENELDLSSIKIKTCRYPSQLANKTIRDIKCIIKNNDISYWDITGYLLSGIKSKIAEFDCQSIIGSSEQKDALHRFLLFLVDVIFFVYANDIRVRSTYLVSQIIITVNRIAKNLDEEHGDSVAKKIEDEVSLIIRKNAADPRTSGVENLNLILAMSEISSNNKLDESDLIKFATGHADVDTTKVGSLNYFQIISLLYYIKNDPEFITLKSKIIDSSILSLKERSILTYADSALIFLDLMSCPYLDIPDKEKLISTVCSSVDSFNEVDFTVEIPILTKRQWFTDWGKQLSIERLLMKKELKAPYS